MPFLSDSNYAVTVVQENGTKSYQVTDLGLGQVRADCREKCRVIPSVLTIILLQVGLSTGQAFASLEDMLIFFYDTPFPDPGDYHVPLTIM